MSTNTNVGFLLLRRPVMVNVLVVTLLLTLSLVEAQFGLQDFDPSPQIDPLRKVFGIWGRLLNRMSQQNPPTDEELHLQGASEGLEAAADRIIDQVRLNELLPRLNPKQTSSTQSTTTTTTTTTSSTSTSTTTEMPITSTTFSIADPIVANVTSSASTEEPTTTTIIKTTTAVPKKKAKKKKKKKSSANSSSTESTADTTTTPVVASTAKTEPLKESITVKKGKSAAVPPMAILKEDGDEESSGQKKDHHHGTSSTAVLGATIRLRTSAEEKTITGDQQQVGEQQALDGGAAAALNESVLARMENETAQLIAEIENVLADSEVGPNAGHWLREGENGTKVVAPTTAEQTSTISAEVATTTLAATTNGNKEEEEEEESGEDEDEEEEEGSDEEEDDDDDEDGDLMVVKAHDSSENTTIAAMTSASTTNLLNNSTTKRASSRKVKVIPEAEEEEQAAEIALLQLDSTVATSTASTVDQNQTSTTAVPQSAQNIFNLNSNANANTNPNFSTMIRPINSVIDGIGPLILPLIGYSRQALDAYSPYALQRAVAAGGVPLFRPSDSSNVPAALSAALQQLSPQLSAHAQQAGVPTLRQGPAVPVPLPHPRQLLSSAQSAQSAVPDPPSLELLGRIVEQRRQRERERLKLQEVSGSAPANLEQKFHPAVLDRGGQQQSGAVLTRPTAPSSTTTATTTAPAEDQGYDQGRRGVQHTFHEDSGLMLGQKPAAPPSPEVSGGDGGGSGFGGGRKPNNAPFVFASRR